MPYPYGVVSTSQAVFTPAATSHTAADVVGGAKEFKGMSQSNSSGVQIVSASLLIATATAPVTTTWRVYLYNVTPPSAVADDGAFDLVSGDRASFIGYVDIAQAVDFGSSNYIQSDNLNKSIRLGSRSAFGYLVNLATVTLEAVAHTVTLHTVG